jgi:phage gp36-like protein
MSTLVELLASTVITADGNSADVTLTDVGVALLNIEVTAYTTSGAGASVKVYVDRRAVATDSWTDGDAFTFTSVSRQSVAVETGALVRVRWDVTNIASATIRVEGVAHQVYAKPSDLSQAIVAGAIAELSASDKARACLTATDTVNGYLTSYVLPLTSWTYDLTLKTAYIAAAMLVTQRGADITGPDSLVYLERDKAVSWLNLVAAGRVRPPGIVDTTPDEYDAGIAVASNPSRWRFR